MLTAALITVAAPAHSQDQQVRRGPAPTWATASEMLPVPDQVSGPTFVRRQDVETHLTAEGEAQYLGYRIKILQSSALQLGNISIGWNPTAGAPIVHEIKLFRDGRMIDVLKDASFEILRREDQLEAARLDGVLTAVLRIPDLRVGDELEVNLTLFDSDPTMGSRSAGLLVLNQAPAPGRYHIGLSWDRDQAPDLKVTFDMEAAMTSGARSVDFRFDNPPLISAPKDAPPRYQWQRAVTYSDFADWAALSQHFAPLYATAATLTAGSDVAGEAARIAAAHFGPLERAAAALKLVQQDVRYIYVGLNGGNLTPASAEETWQRRYGDCKGKTALLLALLAQLGIEAEPVLVNASGADDGLDQRLPIPQLFDHVLVRATIDDQLYWLDGTLPPVARPSASPIYPVQWVLSLRTSGGRLERLSWTPPIVPDEVHLVEIDARAGFEQPARIVTIDIVRGLDGLQQQAQFSSVTEGQLLGALRQSAVGDFWQAIDDVQWRCDEAAGASILTIRGTGTMQWDKDGGGIRSLSLPGGGFNPPERRVRSADQDQDIPYYTKPEFSCHVTTVHLPSSTEPRQWTSTPSFATRIFGRQYYRAWQLRDGSIRMVRGSRVEQPEIDAATARRDNGRIAAFDNSMGWISYDPMQIVGSVGDGESVPTTLGLDWTGGEVPCLSSTLER